MSIVEGRCAALVLALLTLASPAAANEPSRCYTVSDRSPSETKVSLELDHGKRVSAIDVLEGELLCVRVRTDGAGHDRFEVVPEGGSDDTMRIELQRVTRRYGPHETHIALSIRPPRSHRIACRAALSVGTGHDVREVFTHDFGLDQGAAVIVPLGDRTPHHVVLFDLVLDPERAEYVRPRANFLGISLVSSLHVSSLRELNAEFARNGFDYVSEIQPFVGLAFDGGIGKLRLTWDIEGGLHRPGSARSPDVSATFIAVHGGYAVYRAGGFALFPMLGIAGGDQRLRVHGDHPAILPAHFESLAGSEDIRKNLGWVLLSLGSEYRWSLTSGSFSNGGLLFGARAGYALQFAEGQWLRDSLAEPTLPSVPKVDASGPYVRFGIGWYEE